MEQNGDGILLEMHTNTRLEYVMFWINFQNIQLITLSCKKKRHVMLQESLNLSPDSKPRIHGSRGLHTKKKLEFIPITPTYNNIQIAVGFSWMFGRIPIKIYSKHDTSWRMCCWTLRCISNKELRVKMVIRNDNNTKFKICIDRWAITPCKSQTLCKRDLCLCSMCMQWN